MSEVSKILAAIRSRRRKHELDLYAITDAQMYLPTAFTYETMMTGGDGKQTGAAVRDIFLRRADHLDEHAIQIESNLNRLRTAPRSHSQLIWAANQRSRGDLLAALTGLTDADLDRRDGLPDGEMTLRDILEHLIVVERYYTIDARHALERFHAGEPHGDLPDTELPIERPGASLKQLLLDLDQYREEAITALASLTDAELRAPSRWEGITIDVRFLLMRFAHHEREHTDHIRKQRALLGRSQTETERLLGLCWTQHGILEGHLIGMDDGLLDSEPENGDWTIRRTLEHIGSAETYFRRVILNGVNAGENSAD